MIGLSKYGICKDRFVSFVEKFSGMLIHPAFFIRWPLNATSVERSGCVTPLLRTISVKRGPAPVCRPQVYIRNIL